MGEFFSNFLLTARTVLFTPGEFFDQITDEGGFWQPFIYLTICASLYSLFMATVVAISLSSPEMKEVFPALANVPLVATVMFFVCLFVSHVYTLALSACINLICKMTGGQGNFAITYATLATSYTTLLVSWIPLLGALPALYTMVLMYKGIRRVQKVSGLSTVVALVMSAMVVGGTLSVVGFLAGGGLLVGAIFANLNQESARQDGQDIFRGRSLPPEMMERYRKAQEEAVEDARLRAEETQRELEEAERANNDQYQSEESSSSGD